jgi:cobalt-zinc-cadmium efflux system outer membrane protein
VHDSNRNSRLSVRFYPLILLFAPVLASAQRSLTRADAERMALSAGARVTLARADTALALARIRTARTLPNPALAASYSKSVPTRHVSLEIPVFDALFTRGVRVQQAQAEAHASRLTFATERLAALVEVDTSYTAALATNARFRLSRQTARDADSLRLMTVRRAETGDASDLDVDLATVAAGQQVNLATSDSLAHMSALLTLQMLVGIPADSVNISLTDSLALSPRDTATIRVALDNSGTMIGLPVPLTASALAPEGGRVSTALTAAPSVLAAEAALSATDRGVALQKRSIFQLPALSIGAEWGDPDQAGLLPTIGFSIPLPFFNRNQGPIGEAEAEREKARVQVLIAKLETRRRLIEGVRERDQLIAKVIRDRDLVVRAQRVADRSITAYREGAAALPAVLESRRTAREMLGQYIDDLASLLTVNTELRALTQTVTVP